MKNYCITYDLNLSNKNYDGLYDAIKEFNYFHVMDSVWFIKTSFNSTEIYNKLKSQIDDNDSLFICEITYDRSGWINKKAWDWL